MQNVQVLGKITRNSSIADKQRHAVKCLQREVFCEKSYISADWERVPECCATSWRHPAWKNFKTNINPKKVMFQMIYQITDGEFSRLLTQNALSPCSKCLANSVKQPVVVTWTHAWSPALKRCNAKHSLQFLALLKNPAIPTETDTETQTETEVET